MNDSNLNLGVLDKRFLSKSVGMLNPPEPLTLFEGEPIGEALSMLQQNRIGGVILTDKNEKVTGMFTERDVVLKIVLHEIALGDPISNIMTTQPQTIEMTHTIAFALQLMSEHGYRHLPIVDDEDYPIGMISVKDIVDFISRSFSSALHSFPKR